MPRAPGQYPPSNVQSQRRRPGEPDLGQNLGHNPGQQRQPQNPYPHLPSFPAQSPSAQRAAEPAYHYPPALPPQSQPYPGQPAADPRLQDPYAGQPNAGYGHDPYAAPGAYPQPGQPHYPAQPASAPGLDLRGPAYEPQPNLGYAPAPQQGAANYDPMSYDLGSYGAPGRGQRPPQPGYQAAAYGDPRYQQHAEPADDEDALDDEEYEEASGGGGRRWLVLAALVASIGLGGGLAYAYKQFISTPKLDGPPPVVRASRDAPKVLPDSPGGKRLAGADSKLMGRLETDGSPSSPGNDSDPDSGGIKKVQTLVVGRDGTMAAPPPARPTVAVPGTFIGNSFGSAPMVVPPTGSTVTPRLPDAAARRAPAPPPQRPAVVTQKAPPAPTIPVTTANAGDLTSPVKAPPKAKTPAVKQPVPKVADAFAPAAGATPTPAAGPATTVAAAGSYVAVLAFVSTPTDALRKFADLQQKYDVLQGRQPDAVPVDLTAKGMGQGHRLVVGPAGGRDAAANVCKQLATQGFKECWVAANGGRS